MSAVVVEIGANAAQFEKVVAGLPQRTQAATGDMTRAFSSAGKSAARSMGQVSMQVQDIAVQLQAGTKAATILAQQGSQVLSAFGTSGAIAGGVLALGALFYSMEQAAAQAFATLKQEAAGFDENLRQITGGSVSQMTSALEKLKETEKKAKESLSDSPKEGLAAGVFRFFSKTKINDDGTQENRYNESIRLNAELAAKAAKAQADIKAQIVSLSDEEVKIAQLKASRQDAIARKLEIERDLRRELASLQSADPAIRGKLQANARAKAGIEIAQLSAGTPSWFTSMVGGLSSAFTRTIPDLAKAMSEAMTTRVASLRESARSLGAAAFGPLKGDADISTGRGSSVNPLTGSASRQISLMLRQAAALENQAKSLVQSNTLLAAIEKGIRRFSPTYN